MEFQNPNYNALNPNPNPNNLENHTSNLYHHTHHAHETQLTHSPFEELDSTCSTPYVSAPSSPGRGSGPVNGGFYYSAPASPMHFALTSSSYIPSLSSPDYADGSLPVGFEFGSGSGASGSMSSADELFLNGKIRPMKLSTHLERPQLLAPLLDLEEQEEEEDGGRNADKIRAVDRGRSDLRVVRDKSMRRRTRSLSPLRSGSSKWNLEEEEEEMVTGFIENMNKTSGKKVDENGNININGDVNEENSNSNNEGKNDESAPSSASLSASSSRSSSAGRSSKRWVFLKDFLRSKSEGRSNNKFWSTISFSPTLLNNKEKKQPTNSNNNSSSNISSSSSVVNGGGGGANGSGGNNGNGGGKGSMKKPVNGIGKRRRMPHPSAHEMHYTANRAQAEELRKKTYLPYKQGLLGCLGFSSKGYGAMNGFARALNPVSSR